MTCITSLISITKKQIVYIHTESCVTATDSVSLSLFNIGIVLESKKKVICSKGNQQWGKIMREMYHYGNNREGINSVLPVLKESKGLKNDITNLYLDMLYNVISYATAPRQYLRHYDHLKLVLAMGTCLPLTVQALLRQHKCCICSMIFAVAI